MDTGNRRHRGKDDPADKLADVVLSPTAALKLVLIPTSADGSVKRFWLGQTEVTQKQWLALMPTNPSSQTRSDRLPERLVQIRCQSVKVRRLEPT